MCSCACFLLESPSYSNYSVHPIMQIFPSKIIYNEETRHFELVLPNRECEEVDRMGWRGDISEVFSSASRSTMFLTDECIGAVSCE